MCYCPTLVLPKINMTWKISLLSVATCLTKTEVSRHMTGNFLPIIWIIGHFCLYLKGHPFHIITNHKTLPSLRKMMLDEAPTGHKARWALGVQIFEWTTAY